MSPSTFTQLISSPFRLTTNDEHQAFLHERLHISDTQARTNTSTTPSQPFPIAQLPYELRQLIYTQYFARLSTQNVTCSNAHLPHHSLTPLALSSPFLEFDPTQILFYRHATFSFSCPEALKAFSKTLASPPPSSSPGAENTCSENQKTEIYESADRRKNVRKVKVLYGRCDQPTRDWVYLLTSSFPSVEEVTFSVDGEKEGLVAGHRCFGTWWECVRDAVREGLGGRKQVLLRVEDGEWGVVEVVRV